MTEPLVVLRAGATDFGAGRALLRELVAGMTGEDAASIEITATCPDCGGPHGRPDVRGHDLFVSLAGAPGFLVAAVSASGPIGVDVEPIAGDADREAAIGALTGIPSLLHWTRVEAVLKADGRGLRVDPAQVLVDGDMATVGSNRYRLSQPPVHPDLVVSVAERL